MITHLAVLTRGLWFPARPARPTTSVVYAMPHSRCLFAGLSVSALLHAGLFFGLSGEKPPVATVVAPPPSIPELWNNAPPVELTPPPPVVAPNLETARGKTASSGDNDTPDAKPSRNDLFARLPDSLLPGSMSIDIPVLERGRMPDFAGSIEGIPGGPSTNANGPGGFGDVLRPADLDNRPEVKFSVAPLYPGELNHAGIAGNVLVRFIVTPKGGVRDIVVLATDHTRFSAAVCEALIRWRFEPGIKNGRRVNTLMELPFRFTVAN